MNLSIIILRTGYIFAFVKSQIPSSKFQIPSGVIENILGLEIWVLGLGTFLMSDFIPYKV